MFSGTLFHTKYSSPDFKYFLCFMVCLHSTLALVLLWGGPKKSHAGDTLAPLIYVVRRGDTLSEIALHYRVSVEQLHRWNRLRGDKIFQGQHLELWPHSSTKWYVKDDRRPQ